MGKKYHTHTHTLTGVFSASASEDVGDKGLSGLSEGELSTLERYSGSGTYKTYKTHFDEVWFKDFDFDFKSKTLFAQGSKRSVCINVLQKIANFLILWFGFA